MVASFSQIEPYIIQSESHGNNYSSSQNYDYPNSTASGYYQITNSTWAGIPTSITGGTQSASQATFAQQQAAANYLWNQNAGADWINWNPTVAAANAALVAGGTPATSVSPMVSNLIASNGGTGSGGANLTYTAPGSFVDPATGNADYGGGGDIGTPYYGGSYGGGLDPGALPATGGDPTAPAIIPGASNNPITQLTDAIGNPLQAIGEWLSNWAVRLGLIAVGIVLIGAAAANLAKEHDVLPPVPME